MSTGFLPQNPSGGLADTLDQIEPILAARNRTFIWCNECHLAQVDGCEDGRWL